MARNLIVGGVTYQFPNDGDLDWGQDVYNWAEAVSNELVTAEERGIPSGGLSGQIIQKASNNDYDTEWVNPPSGGGGGGGGVDSYSAGHGLNLVGTTFSIATDGVTTPEIKDGAVTLSKLAAGSTSDQILVYDGSDWTLEAKPSGGGSSGVADLSGVVGGSGISVTHTESNQKASISVVPSIQGALVPTGGATNQVLTKQSGTDHDLFWSTPSGGGGGGGTPSENSVSFAQLVKPIRNYVFQAPLQHSSADLTISDLDEANVIATHDHTLAIIPRAAGADGNNIYATGLDGRTTGTITFADSASSSEFGVTYNKKAERFYRPTIASNTVTHLLAYDTDGVRQTSDDITLDTAIPGTNTIRTSLTYNCLLYTSPSPRDRQKSRMPSSA